MLGNVKSSLFSFYSDNRAVKGLCVTRDLSRKVRAART